MYSTYMGFARVAYIHIMAAIEEKHSECAHYLSLYFLTWSECWRNPHVTVTPKVRAMHDDFLPYYTSGFL